MSGNSVEVTGAALFIVSVVAPNRKVAKIAKVRDELMRTASVGHRKVLEPASRPVGTGLAVGQFAAADQRRGASEIAKSQAQKNLVGNIDNINIGRNWSEPDARIAPSDLILLSNLESWEIWRS